MRLVYEGAKGWNDAQEFWEKADGFFNKDGLVAHKNYEIVIQSFLEARKVELEQLEGEQRKKFEQSTGAFVEELERLLCLEGDRKEGKDQNELIKP